MATNGRGIYWIEGQIGNLSDVTVIPQNKWCRGLCMIQLDKSASVFVITNECKIYCIDITNSNSIDVQVALHS